MIEKKYVNENYAEIVLSGEISSQDIKDMHHELFRANNYEKRIYHLIILENVSRINLTTAEIMAIIEDDKKYSPLNPDLRLAFVADSDSTYGLCRMYEGFYNNFAWQTAVFHRLEEAKIWVNS